MTNNSFNSLMKRLSSAGFTRKFVDSALLPEWWEEPNSRDPELLPELEIRVARFLNVPLSSIKES